MSSSSPSHSLQQQLRHEGKMGMTSWLPCNWSIDSNATCKTSCHSCRHSSGRRERAPARGEELRALSFGWHHAHPGLRARPRAHSRGERAHLTPETATPPLKLCVSPSVVGARARASPSRIRSQQSWRRVGRVIRASDRARRHFVGAQSPDGAFSALGRPNRPLRRARLGLSEVAR